MTTLLVLTGMVNNLEQYIHVHTYTHICAIYSYKLENESAISTHPFHLFVSMFAWKWECELLFVHWPEIQDYVTIKYAPPKILTSCIVNICEFEEHQQTQKLQQFVGVPIPSFFTWFSIIPSMMPSRHFSPESIVCGLATAASAC